MKNNDEDCKINKLTLNKFLNAELSLKEAKNSKGSYKIVYIPGDPQRAFKEIANKPNYRSRANDEKN